MKVFVDASVILAALGSKTGGSSLVLRLGAKGKLDLTTSQAVVEEVRRNTRKISVPWTDTERLIIKSRISVVPAPGHLQVEKYERIVGEKDAHVLASAIASKAQILITLDKKHILQAEVKQKVKNVELLMPGELLQRGFLFAGPEVVGD